jgi:hypothetical protein
MTEAVLCACPKSLVDGFGAALLCFRALVDVASLPAVQATALKTLLHCYEASVWRALDFHDFTDLQSHRVCSLRTQALLASLRDRLPHQALESTLAAIRSADRDCGITGADQAPPRPSQQAWNARLLRAVERLPARSTP